MFTKLEYAKRARKILDQKEDIRIIETDGGESRIIPHSDVW